VEELLAGWDVVKWYGRPFLVHNAVALTKEERVRFDRLIRTYGEEHIRLLKSMTIGIIGLGRLGSAIFQALLESGVSRFILIDPDVVNQENKALWSYAGVQVGEAKVEALQAAAERFGAEVIGVQKDILELSLGECQLLYDLDIAFCCTDCLLPRIWLSAICARSGIPLISGGIHIVSAPPRSPELRGRVHICIPGHSCLFCIPDALPLEACSEELNRLTRGEQVGRPGEADPNLSGLLARSAVHALHQIVSGTIPAAQVDYELTQAGTTARSIPLRTLPSCEVCRPQVPRQQPQLETQQRLTAPSSEASSFKTRVWGAVEKAVVGLGTITAGVVATVVGATVAFGVLLLIRHVIGYESLWRYSPFENILHFLLQFDSWRYYDHSFWNYLGLILSSYIVLLIPYILFGLPLFGVQRAYRALDARLARWRRAQALEEVAENRQYALIRDLIHNLRSRERILHVRPLVRRALQRSA
jgi:molybdopterin/thiamine biosynthesis adenylyltransferase